MMQAPKAQIHVLDSNKKNQLVEWSQPCEDK